MNIDAINKLEEEIIQNSISRKLVNECIEESFGKKFKGNIKTHGNGYTGFHYYESTTPNMIANFSFLCRFNPKMIGFFNERDPTKIHIKYRFVEKAKKYAELYERKTGKEVIVGLMDEDCGRVFQ